MSELQTYKANYLPKDPRWCVFGKTGGGKSYFVNHYLIPKMKSMYRIIILDTKNEYANKYQALSLEDFKHRNFVRRVNQIKNGKEIITDFNQIIEIVAGIVMQVPYTILIVEEASLILRKGLQLYSSLPNTAKLLFQGRSTHNGIILVAQSPVNLSLDPIRQSSNIFCFEMEPVEEENAHKYFGYYVDFAEIRKNPYSFWEKAHNQLYQKISDKTKKMMYEKNEGKMLNLIS